MSTLRRTPFTYVINGFEHHQIAGHIHPEHFLRSLSYKPKDSDVFVCSYPKCGTTWVQVIVALFLNDMKLPEGNIVMAMVHDNYLEYYLGKEGAEAMKEPRQLKSHLPFDMIPFNPSTKYIYVVRNPFDCCVSQYNFIYNRPSYQFNGSFDDFFELFIIGKTPAGDYFDHLMSWYGHRNDPNVLIVVYEELKKDPATIIRKIGNFLGSKYEDIAKDPSSVERIVRMSSFESLKENEEKNRAGTTGYIKEGGSFFRKGKVGDHLSKLSKSQKERLMAKYNSYVKGTYLMEVWRDHVL